MAHKFPSKEKLSISARLLVGLVVLVLTISSFLNLTTTQTQAKKAFTPHQTVLGIFNQNNQFDFISLFHTLFDVPAPIPTHVEPVAAAPTPPTPTPQTTLTKPTSTPPKPNTPPPAPKPEDAMLALINKARNDAGLQNLQVDPKLAQIAYDRSLDMATKNYFSHTSPTGETFFTILKADNIPYHYAAENIADNDFSASQTVQVAFNGWMNSPGHKANILNANYTLTGIGIATSKTGLIYYTQVFLGY